MKTRERTAGCIDREMLERYLTGQINDSESRPVSLHLASCERCVQTCQALTSVDDEFIAELRQIEAFAASAVPPECAVMMDRIQQHAQLSRGSFPEAPPADSVGDQADPVETRLMSEESTEPDLASGEIQPVAQFGRYTITQRLGAGGMAAVHQAFDNRLSRNVALKLPHRAIQADPVARSRFQQEARAAAAVSHPNVCGVLDIGEFDGLCYLTLPLLKGHALSQRLQRAPRLELSQVVDIICELCDGLSAVHAHGVIHRDIKPANIFLTTEGRVVLMDFGIALATQSPDRLTQAGLLMGTPAYFSPEQAAGDWKNVTASADIYAVGVVLYELLTGRTPFDGPAGVVIGKILHEAPPPLISHYPACDQRLRDICMQAMAYVPSARFSTIAHLRDALRDWQQTILRDGHEDQIELTANPSVNLGSDLTEHRELKRKLPSDITWAARCAGVVVAITLMAIIVIRLKSRWGEIEVSIQPDSTAEVPNQSSVAAKEKSTRHVDGQSQNRRGPWPAVSDSARRALPELANLPNGMSWLACLSPDQIHDSEGQTTTPGQVEAASVSRDGQTLAMLQAGPVVSLWDLRQPSRRSFFALPKYDTTLTLSADGTRLLTAGGGWRVRVWDTLKSTELAALPGHTNWINTIAVDDRNQFAASTSKDGTVRCWDLGKQSLLWTQPHGSWARSVAITSSGEQIASGGQDGIVKLWQVNSGAAAGHSKVSTKPIVGLSFLNHGSRFAALDLAGTLHVWDCEKSLAIWSRTTLAGHPMRVSVDDKSIAVTSTAGAVTLLNTSDGSLQLQCPNPPPGRTWSSIGFTTDQQLLIRSSDDYLCILSQH